MIFVHGLMLGLLVIVLVRVAGVIVYNIWKDKP